MLKLWSKNPFVTFIAKSFVFFLFWQLSYFFFIEPNGFVDNQITINLIKQTNRILHFVGFDTLPVQDPDTKIKIAGIDGTTGVWVGDPCNGLILFVLFFTFIFFYPYGFKHKFWFIPIGIISIHIINSIRVASLALILKYKAQWLDFNHNYTFTIIVYSYVFLLWYFWIKLFGKPEIEKKIKLK
jgi:exosortase family protein XrtF